VTLSDEGLDRTRPEGLTGILDALTDAVTQARAMPMSSSVLVNRVELLDLLEQAREVLPTQLSQADDVLRAADEARAAAQADADAIVDDAHARAAELVEVDAITAAARVRAQEILAEAEREADGLRRDADEYCDRRLAEFEVDLGKILTQVGAGRAKLAGRLGTDADV
jgi:regulator of protease activity HflC (stomatin/prohibitin superfamily)